MADQAGTEPYEDLDNPYLAPTRELGQPWGTGDLELEAIRRANLADEAYLKILVRANFVIAAMICAFGGYYLSFPIRHALGQIDAPWVGKPNWIAFYCAAGSHAGSVHSLGLWTPSSETLGVVRRNAACSRPLDLLGVPASQS